jgi:hypothetical protein
MRRFRLKNGLRAIAVGLIIFPEPITTAIGIILLSATFALFREKSLSKFGDLEALVRKSLQTPEPAGFRRYIATRREVVNRLIQPDTPSQPPRAPAQYNPWFDNRKVSGPVLHHTLKTSFPQYEARPEFMPGDDLRADLKNAGAAVHYHKLKSSLFPEPMPGWTESQPKKRTGPDPLPVLHHLKLN